MSRERVESDLADRASNPHYVTLLGLCNDLLRGRFTIIVIVVCWAIGAAFVRLAQPRTYTASGSFVPDVVQPLQSSEQTASPLGVLASAAMGGSPSRSSQLTSVGSPSALPTNKVPLEPLDTMFYRALLQSPPFLVSVAGRQFTFTTPSGTRTGTAADAYGLPPGPAAKRLDDAGRRLGNDIEVTSNDTSGIVTLSVRTTDPELSRSATERLLDALREQNRRMSDARTTAQVAYLTREVLEAQNESRLAQDAFANFLASNRSFEAASQVSLEFQRRDADVVEKRQHYAELALQLERAKLDQSRATQLIWVVQRPVTPLRPDPRALLRTVLIGGVGGAALGILIVLTGAHVRRLRAAGSRDLATLGDEWRAARRVMRPGSRAEAPAMATVGSGETG